jgi:hypothetical protein
MKSGTMVTTDTRIHLTIYLTNYKTAVNHKKHVAY